MAENAKQRNEIALSMASVVEGLYRLNLVEQAETMSGMIAEIAVNDESDIWKAIDTIITVNE